MNYNDYKNKQLLIDMQKKITTISSFIKTSKEDMKLVDNKMNSVYSINEQSSPIPKLRKELDDLNNTIDKVLLNISNELKLMK